MGSSAAAIALGLTAAAPTAGAESCSPPRSVLEDHADNLAAALVGGVTLTSGGRIARVADTLPLQPVAIVPAQRMSTALSRHALPESVSHADAAATAGHAALLGAAIAAGDAELFARALVDRLHEPYRPSAVLDAVRADPPAGARGATLSGSGPTVIVWADEPARCAAALRERFDDHDVLELQVTPHGALTHGAIG